MGERLIALSGGGPWGFTLSGGKDFGAPLKVSKITAGGKAAKGGIKFGDYIWEINGDSTEGLLHSDAMMLIKTTGVTLNLKVSKELPKSYAGDGPISAADGNQSSERPRPPPIPQSTNVTSPVQKTTVVVPKKATAAPPEPPRPAYIEAGATEDVQQSPAFKRITIQNRPTVFKQPADSPPTQQMKNIVIDDGNVRKTSQKPASPGATSKAPTSGPRKDPPIAKPPPPVTSGGTTQVGGQPAAGDGKVVDRQGICESCKQPIRGPYASAVGKVWHTEHFVCNNCSKSMQNTSFIYEDDTIFCEECYQNKFAQTCHACQKPIVGAIISAVGLHWHQEHFTCSRCTTDLTKGSGFNMENNLLFCSDCYGAVYGASCFGCGQKIGGNDLWVEALEHTWHPACFVCETCRKPLEGTSFFARLGHPCCKDCV